jgi:hypothetical protein
MIEEPETDSMYIDFSAKQSAETIKELEERNIAYILGTRIRDAVGSSENVHSTNRLAVAHRFVGDRAQL